jgi:hypothetical protein
LPWLMTSVVVTAAEGGGVAGIWGLWPGIQFSILKGTTERLQWGGEALRRCRGTQVCEWW